MSSVTSDSAACINRVERSGLLDLSRLDSAEDKPVVDGLRDPAREGRLEDAATDASSDAGSDGRADEG